MDLVEVVLVVLFIKILEELSVVDLYQLQWERVVLHKLVVMQVMLEPTLLFVNLLDLEFLLQKVVDKVIETIVVHLVLIQDQMVDQVVVVEVGTMELQADLVDLQLKHPQCPALYSPMVLVVMVDLEPQDPLVKEVVAVAVVEPVEPVEMRVVIMQEMVVMVKQ
tara:strand:- start:306 stop:797 length:492 start_codon:yes stop_codon:yes gene_type:complete